MLKIANERKIIKLGPNHRSTKEKIRKSKRSFFGKIVYTRLS